MTLDAPAAARGPVRRALDGLYALGGGLAALCVLGILVLMVWASLGRLLEWRVSWVNDVVSWLCAAAAFLGMAYSFRNGDFVRVTLLLEVASPRVRHWPQGHGQPAGQDLPAAQRAHT
ncbi:MAG: TRAP transporter small permease subunit, partial [Hydrogenophaga sp.]|uniref:TRAP transporter small permease subunit n=1 Tax=Hydrogenophaga sp. TaxID=1904254 RepID=UPI004035E579